MSDLITSQMLSDWRANYGLDKRTPIKAMHWWQDNMDGKAPAGVVAALGLCINEIERLTAERNALRDDNAKLNGWMEEEAQAAGRLQRKLNAAEEEIERLTASLKRANETAEHFERHWYLRGDEIERLTAERDELRRQLAEAEQDARRYRWLRGEHKRVDPICAVIWKRNGDRNGSEWVNTANIDAEIDAAMGASNE
jgi:glutathione S-transferase